MKASLRSQRAFAFFLAASVVVHALFFSELTGWTPAPHEETPTITAQLEPMQPLPKLAPAPQKRPVAVAKPRAPAPIRPAVSPPVMTAPSPAPAPADTAPAAEDAPAGSGPDTAAETAAGEAQTAPQESAAQSAPEPAVAAAETATEVKLPSTGSITYEVYFGTDKFSIGRSVQTWSIDKSTYRLTSFSETTGIVGLFRPYQYAYVSEGRIDASGLRPETFAVRRGREGERQAMARFDWDKGELTFGPLSALRKVPLQSGTYDFLSFIFQLTFKPLPPGRKELVITTGTKLNTYVLEIGAEEMVELPMGTVRAVPIRQLRMPGEESVQVWLAAEAPHLPVRIRFLDRQGRMSVEQLAQKIEINGA